MVVKCRLRTSKIHKKMLIGHKRFEDFFLKSVEDRYMVYNWILLNVVAEGFAEVNGLGDWPSSSPQCSPQIGPIGAQLILGKTT